MSTPTSDALPAFAEPPVQEVALSVQFSPLVALGVPQLGLLWAEFRDRFPLTQEHAPLPHILEEFGQRRPFRVGLEVTTMDAPPVPRCWFLNEAGSELIQVQQDRFIHNWRKVAAVDQYPSYSQLRDVYHRELEQFNEFLRREGISELVPNQCEVTYVDQLVAGRGWEHHGQLERVLTVWSAQYSDSFLPEPESVQLNARYLIPGADGAPAGRLHIMVEPAYRAEDELPILLMRTTARGRPQGEGIEGALRFLDIGHDWAVRGFVSITTQHMHELWRRIHDS